MTWVGPVAIVEASIGGDSARRLELCVRREIGIDAEAFGQQAPGFVAIAARQGFVLGVVGHLREDIESTACLGKIVTHQRLENGGYELLILGMKRIRIIHELVEDHPFRRAKVELLDDLYCPDEGEERAALQTALTHRFQQCLPSGTFPSDIIQEALSSEIPLGVLTDLVSFAIPLDHDTKYRLLTEQDVDLRAWNLLKAMDALTACSKQPGQQEPDTDGPLIFRQGKFPPPFSSN